MYEKILLDPEPIASYECSLCDGEGYDDWGNKCYDCLGQGSFDKEIVSWAWIYELASS